MKLLFLTAETCPTFRADVTALFGKYLPRGGVYTDIVAGLTPGHPSPVSWGGGEAHLCDISGGQARKYVETLLHGIRCLFHADRRYRAIQVRDMPVLAAFGLLASRMKGLPFFYWMSYPIPEGRSNLARERGLSAGVMKFLFPWVAGAIGKLLLYRLVLPNADHVFVQSDRMRQKMAARGIRPDKMTPVPMGVDLEDADADKVQLADDARLQGRRVLVYLGSLDRPRKIEVLFEMLALVKRDFPDSLLVLVGDTEDQVHRAWLRAEAQAAGVADDVIWTGWLSMGEGWRYVRSAQLGLSPIPRGPLLDVGSPTKVFEYLALGVPVVGNDNPDQESVLRESGAGACVPYTAEAFAHAVVEILLKSAHERQALVERGRSYVTAKRSYEVISTKLAEKYEQLLGT